MKKFRLSGSTVYTIGFLMIIASLMLEWERIIEFINEIVHSAGLFGWILWAMGSFVMGIGLAMCHEEYTVFNLYKNDVFDYMRKQKIKEEEKIDKEK